MFICMYHVFFFFAQDVLLLLFREMCPRQEILVLRCTESQYVICMLPYDALRLIVIKMFYLKMENKAPKC